MVGHRRRKRWPIDATTLGKQLKVLAGHSTAQQIEIIERSINAGWQGLFPPKTVNGNGHRGPPAASDDALWADAGARAKAINFRAPHAAETASSYMGAVKRAEDAPPETPLAERRGLAGLPGLVDKLRSPR